MVLQDKDKTVQTIDMVHFEKEAHLLNTVQQYKLTTFDGIES